MQPHFFPSLISWGNSRGYEDMCTIMFVHLCGYVCVFTYMCAFNSKKEQTCIAPIGLHISIFSCLTSSCLIEMLFSCQIASNNKNEQESSTLGAINTFRKKGAGSKGCREMFQKSLLLTSTWRCGCLGFCTWFMEWSVLPELWPCSVAWGLINSNRKIQFICVMTPSQTL